MQNDALIAKNENLSAGVAEAYQSASRAPLVDRHLKLRRFTSTSRHINSFRYDASARTKQGRIYATRPLVKIRRQRCSYVAYWHFSDLTGPADDVCC